MSSENREQHTKARVMRDRANQSVILIFKKKKISQFLGERKGESGRCGGGRREGEPYADSKLNTEPGARRAVQSHDPGSRT